MDEDSLMEANEDFLESILPDGWETDGYGMESMFICPHGNLIEQDGRGSCGCISPLLRMGLI